MAYEAEEVLSSQEIFYYLLEHHELREEDEPLLYKAYIYCISIGSQYL